MGYKEYKAKTLDEAITAASIDLGVTSSELFYEVVDKGSSGILGFGKKDTTIKACKLSEKEEDIKPEIEISPSVKEDYKSEDYKKVEKKEHHKKEVKELPEADEETIKRVAADFLTEVFEKMDLQVEISQKFSKNDNSLSIDLSGNNMGIIIGKRGQTLDSLQYLVNLVVNKKSEAYIRVKLDTEDYRRRRKETLENLAKNLAKKVKKTGEPVTLEAMNPYERRTIHFALQKDRDVTTYSEGEEPNRRVVIVKNREK